MIESVAIINLLTPYISYDNVEKLHVLKIIDFAKSQVNITDRHNKIGHVTASGWVLNKDGTRALLLHHTKLDRWMQPGGHIEHLDDSLADAALREVTEETGIVDVNLKKLGLFDVDVHEVPANTTMQAHLHFDVRFLFQALLDDIKLSNESIAYQWVKIDESPNIAGSISLKRMFEKSIKRTMT